MRHFRFRDGSTYSAAAGFMTKKRAALASLSLATSVTDPFSGVVFNFVASDGVTPEERLVGQHVMGDYFVYDPDNTLRIGSTEPEFERGTGTVRHWRGVSTSGDLWINGMMKNPTKLTRTTGQGFCSYYYDSNLRTPGDLALNIDPGYTGAPVTDFADGDVLVKGVSFWLPFPPTATDTGGNSNIGTITTNYGTLTIRRTIPRVDSFRPATSPLMKAQTIDIAADDIDWAKLNRTYDLSDITDAPTFKDRAEALEGISSYAFAFMNDNSRNVRAVDSRGSGFTRPVGYRNNDLGYDRDEARRFSESVAMLFNTPTTGDNSPEWRRRLVLSLAQYSLENCADLRAGSSRQTGAGYGMGWASVASFAYLLFKFDWLWDLRKSVRPDMITGIPKFYDSEQPQMGVFVHGPADENRYASLPAEYVAYTKHFMDSTETRAFAIAFQETDVGVPMWFVDDTRFSAATGLNLMRANSNPAQSYHQMQGAASSAILAVGAMRGGLGALNNSTLIQFFDRHRRIWQTGLSKGGEGGYIGFSRDFWSRMRPLVPVEVWQGRPETPLAPVVEGFLGDSSILKVKINTKLCLHDLPILRHDLRYTATTPSAVAYDEDIWTEVQGVTVEPFALLTGLPYAPGTKVFVQHRVVTAGGASGWSPSHRRTTRYARDEDGAITTPRRMLGAFEDPAGSQAAVTVSDDLSVVGQNTIAPKIIGAPTVGQELVFDPGEWAVEPWDWTVTWKVGTSTVLTGSLESARVLTTPNNVSSVVTVEWVAANSTSSTSGTTAGVTIRAAEVVTIPLVAQGYQATFSNSAAHRNRILNGVAGGEHPVRRLGLMCASTSSTGNPDPGSTGTLYRVMRLQTAGGTSIDPGTENELFEHRAQHAIGGRRSWVRWYDVQSASSGGERFNFFSENRDMVHAMAAFDLSTKFDLSAAWSISDNGRTEVNADEPDANLDFEYTLTDAQSRLIYIPKGSIILAATAWNMAPDLTDPPTWSDNLTRVESLTGVAKAGSLTTQQHMVSVAWGIHPASGPLTVTLEQQSCTSAYATSVLIIPPM